MDVFMLKNCTTSAPDTRKQLQGPHSHILMTGGPTEVHILYPKKSQLQNLSTQKNPYFF